MAYQVGLLPSGNHQQVPFAYKMYSGDSERGWEQSVAFVSIEIAIFGRVSLVLKLYIFQKRTFSMDIDIAFVGVW